MLKSIFNVKLNFDRNIVVIIVISTILLMLDRYHIFMKYKVLDRVVLYLIAPLLIIILVFRENPKEYGFQIGDWKAGIVITLGAVLLIGPVLWFVARSDANMRAYYDRLNTPIMPLMTFLDLIGWEFFFRGWILFGFARKFGDHALWLQAVPFALAHLGKPEVETLSTIFGGFLFGLVAWRTKSFLYPFLIHWFVFSFTVIAAAWGM
jgi:membrane protease YdiL (CAAX protease family)